MGELSLPMTTSYLLNFEGLHVLEGSKPIIGLREIEVTIEMTGKAPVDIGGSREAGGWIPGTPKYTATMTWELTWWTEYMRSHPRYVDEILNRTFAWLSRAREHEISFRGLSFMKENGSAKKGHDGALEQKTDWGALGVKKTVDGTEIPMFNTGVL